LKIRLGSIKIGLNPNSICCIIFFDIWKNMIDEKLILEWKIFMKISYFEINFSYFETSIISVLARKFKCLKNSKFMHHVSKLYFYVSKHHSTIFLYMFWNALCLGFNVCYVYMLYFETYIVCFETSFYRAFKKKNMFNVFWNMYLKYVSKSS